MRVHVIGASGYAAGDVVRLIARHPHCRLGAVESVSHAGQAIGAHLPLVRHLERPFDPPGTVLATLEPGEIVVSGAKHDEIRALAPEVLARGGRVLDLSDAFRLHAHAGEAVYGFSERYRDAISHARLVANPGCYPTASLLALWPLAKILGRPLQLIIDAKSGVSGAGRSPQTSTLFAEVDGDVRAYGFEGHRHEPEIIQELAALGIEAPLVFTPQVVPIRRGMLVCAYAIIATPLDEDSLLAAYHRCYAGSPFVRVLPRDQAPSLIAVAGTNDAEIHVSLKGNVVRALCAIDNLGKGAAGQALQNINLMYGLSEELGLDDRHLVL
jgi:N-acetyl-gamma-glutamyl-phosphate reductase